VYTDGRRCLRSVGTAKLRPWMKKSFLEGKLSKELKVPEESRGRRKVTEPPARNIIIVFLARGSVT
jgi:hypothetical protein